MPLIVDAHEDLAWNALTFGRDYTRAARATRALEQGTEIPAHNGQTLLGLDDWLRGEVALIFSSLFASPVRRQSGAWDVLVYREAAEAQRLYAAQVDYYTRLTDECERLALVRGRGDLQTVLESWQTPEPDRRRIGLVLLMEGADGVGEPKDAEAWQARGVRILGPAWTGTRYAGGTGEPGPLTFEGRQLLNVMADLGLILDLAHMSDESYLEALDHFEGTVLVSHANPRARLKDFTPPERLLSDQMIARLAERGGMVGIMPYNRFLRSGWRRGDRKDAVTLAAVVAAIDHVCQVTGSAAHVGLGTDFDGGLGVEHVPAEIDTVADLRQLGPALRAHGYTEADCAAILGLNWIALLQRGLPA